MDRASLSTVDFVPPQHRLTYPPEKIVAAVGRSDTDRIVTALEAIGFARDRVEIISADEVKGLGGANAEPGLYRLLVRLDVSLADDLTELERARQDLAAGYALVQVRFQGDEEHVRAHAILNQHGSHAMHYFGRWAITQNDQL